MDVAVHHKHGQRQPHPVRRPSLLGEGMLDRARATSLALLGVTAAVGLAMIALALNLGWPLLAGAPIPGFEDGQQAVGDAAVAAQAEGAGDHVVARGSDAAQQGSQSAARPTEQGATKGPAPEGPRLPGEGIVVSHPISADSPSGNAPTGAAPSPVPAASQPSVPPTPEPTSSPAAPDPSSPQPTPASPAPSTSVLTSDEVRERDHGRHSGRRASRGNPSPEAEDDSDESEARGRSEPTPGPPAGSPPDAEGPAEPERDESQTPSGSRGGGHGYGHGRRGG